MMQAGVVTPSDSPWSAAAILVSKKDQTWRFCFDYRKSNNITTKNVYPLPRVEDTLSRLNGAHYFTIMDLQLGFSKLN